MDYTIRQFDQGILLFTILISSVIMTVSLIMNRGEKVTDVLLDSIKMKPNDNNIIDSIEDAIVFNNNSEEGNIKTED